MATLSKGYSFGATEQVTAAKLHSLVDSATISSIATADISNNAVTNDKIQTVDGSKLTGLASIPSGSGTVPDANLPAMVKTSGDQTVNGVKTFGSFPVTPSSAPTTDYQTANKKYVDDNLTTDAGDITTGVFDKARLPCTYMASDNTLYGWTGSIASLATSYTKVFEYRIALTGTFRIVFTGTTDGATSPYYRIYKNGSGFGTQRTSAGTYSEDLAFAADDYVQLYIYRTGGGGGDYVRVSSVYIRGSLMLENDTSVGTLISP